MNRIRLFIIVLISLFAINVRAEELPTIISHKVMVTNKEGTVCYQEGKKTDITIPYKTMLIVNYDINGNYINVTNDDYNCDVKFSDVSANNQKFSLDTKGVDDIKSIRAIVLPSTGLNMRIGPSVTYAKVTIIPQNELVTLTHKAGTYWYYTEYNGKTGWITAMNNYLGFDSNKVLINYEKTNIYNNKGTSILGNIPADTAITDYVLLPTDNNGFKYYVKYNNTTGYIKDMLYKTNGTGKIRLIKDVELKDQNGNPIKRMTSGSELEYTMVNENGFYFPSRNTVINLESDDFEYIKETKQLVKDKGYLGEGIFGEEKQERIEETPTPNSAEPEIVDDENESMSTRDIIIICLLGGIFLALTAIVIIKLVNSKKEESVIVKEKVVEDNIEDNKE